MDEREPVAWAIYGRVSGRVRKVTLDEDYADECREFYDVKPLYLGVSAWHERSF